MTRPELNDERLLAYAAGELPATGAETMEAILMTNPERAAMVARYQAVQRVLRADDSVEPPAAVLTRAMAIFPARAERTAPDRLFGLFNAARRVVAELTFEAGGGMPALAGFRGGDATRQFVFEAEGTVVDLQIEPPIDHEQRWRIMGQVETDLLDGGLVVGLAPLSDEGSAIAVTTDAHGGFHFSAIAGQYNIFVRIDETLVVLPNLVIG
ncbi:MAG: hypothetical protein M3464_20280 [Chloroflexota bacterium]|nr:hypothetical protein [Chloroflexota bacterium]